MVFKITNYRQANKIKQRILNIAFTNTYLMKTFKILSTLILIISLLTVTDIKAQNPVNWTKDQLMEPAQLAEWITNNKPLPIIISVGPGAVIKNSIDIGSVKDSSNLNKLKARLADLPKDTAIVVYCGCCPYEHCPNVRPAIDALKNLHFTNYKLLDLPKNIKTDWLDKNYPTAN